MTLLLFGMTYKKETTIGEVGEKPREPQISKNLMVNICSLNNSSKLQVTACLNRGSFVSALF